MKNIYIIIMVLVVIGLFWNQNTINSNIWIKMAGIVVFFLGMMKLSAKTPSKNKENEE